MVQRNRTDHPRLLAHRLGQGRRTQEDFHKGAHVSLRAGYRGRAHRRRQARLGTLLQLLTSEPGRIPADEGLLHGRGRGGRHYGPLQRRRTHQGRSVKPTTQGSLGGAQGIEVEHLIGVQKQGRSVTAESHGLSPGSRHDQGRFRANRRAHVVARGGNHRNVREGAAQLLGRAHRSHRRGTPAVKTTFGAPPLLGQMAAPRTGGHRGTGSQRKRAAAHGTSGWHAAPRARERGHVTAAGHLHEHRASGQGAAGVLEGKVRDARHGSQRVASQLVLRTGREDARRILTHERARSPQVGGPAGAYQACRLATHREPCEERRGVLR